MSLREETAQGDIAYLPGSFGEVRSNLRFLSSLKKDWKIQILKDAYSSEVNLEEEFKIRVMEKDWEDFVKDISPLIKGTFAHDETVSFEFKDRLEEDVEDKVDQLLTDIHDALMDILTLPESKKVTANSVNLAAVFNRFKRMDIKRKDVMIRAGESLRGVDAIMALLKKEYSSDVGYLELFLDALKTKQPLKSFDGFDKFTYLFGDNTRLIMGKQNLWAGFYVDMNYNYVEELSTNDMDATEQMEEELKDVKVQGGKITVPGGLTRNTMEEIYKVFTEA